MIRGDEAAVAAEAASGYTGSMSSMGVLRGIARWLDGTHSRYDRVAHGKRRGVPAAVRFALRGTGYERSSSDRRWTEVDVQLPPGYALSLYVRRHEWTDQHQIERRRMLDIELGDPDFDRQFLIEAAPAQIVRSLLDPSIRRLLASYAAVSLTTELMDGRSVLRLAVTPWLNHDAITAAVDALVDFGGGLRDAHAALEAAALCNSGSPYRPRLDGAQIDAQRAALADEVALVAGLRVNR